MTITNNPEAEAMVSSAVREIVRNSIRDKKYMTVKISEKDWEVKTLEKVNFFMLPKEKITMSFIDKYDTGSRILAVEYAARELLDWAVSRNFHTYKNFLVCVKQKRSYVKVHLFMFDKNSTIVL